MKIKLIFIIAFSLAFSAKGQGLRPIKELPIATLLPYSKSIFNSTDTRAWFPSLKNIGRGPTSESFVYFPSSTQKIKEESSKPDQITLLSNTINKCPNKTAIYQQQWKLLGKFIFRSALELIPCNDLEYFIPEVMARNY